VKAGYLGRRRQRFLRLSGEVGGFRRIRNPLTKERRRHGLEQEETIGHDEMRRSSWEVAEVRFYVYGKNPSIKEDGQGEGEAGTSAR